MANNNVVASATGSYSIDIDSDNDSTTQTFKVTHHNGGQLLMEVKESGDVSALGKADFSSGGTRTKQVSAAPINANGQDGDVLVNSDGVEKKLYVKIGGIWHGFSGTPACW